jgi:hypothetical protein
MAAGIGQSAGTVASRGWYSGLRRPGWGCASDSPVRPTLLDAASPIADRRRFIVQAVLLATIV